MAKKPSSANDRWKLVTEASTPKLIWSSDGEPGSGTSWFALSAPGPIHVHSLDQGLKGVVDDFKDEKEIYVIEYPWGAIEKSEGMDDARDIAIDLLAQFQEDFEVAVAKIVKAGEGTLVFDKEDQVWDLLKYSNFGSAKGDYRDYDALNAKMKYFFDVAKREDINFGLLQGHTNHWKDKNIIGRKCMGWEHTRRNVNVVLEHSFDQEEKRYCIHVNKARGPNALMVQGQDFYNMRFEELAELLFTAPEE